MGSNVQMYSAISILASAFGEKYYSWISLPVDNKPLSEEEKNKLEDLIKERDHYEIKQTIVKHKMEACIE